MPRPLHVGFDADGPLFDYVAALRRRLTAHGHPARPLRRSPAHYKISCCWGMEPSALHEHMVAGARTGILLDGPARRGAAAAMGSLLRDGHRVSVVTARQLPGADAALIEADTRSWLAREGLPHTDVLFARDKGAFGLDALLDDRPEHVREVNAAGGLGVLYRTTWNTEDHASGLATAGGFRDFLKLVRRIA